MTNKVLILSAHHEVLIDAIRSLGLEPVLYLNQSLSDLGFEELGSIIGVVTSNACVLDRTQLSLMPSLRFVGRLGSGMEIIDTEYCAEKGISFWSSPMGNANAVAEHALGMLISLNNHMRKAHLEMNNGLFLRKENTCLELSNMHVGVLGLGSNGAQFTEKLLNLGIRVTAVDIDPTKNDKFDHELFSFSTSIESLCSCNAVSLHIPLNQTTHHIINYQFIEQMNVPFILINCARGFLVDTHTLYKGLKTGKIKAAGIDVWEYEPISQYPNNYQEEVSYIISHNAVIATPHIAGYTHDATYKMSLIIAEKIKEWFNISFIQ